VVWSSSQLPGQSPGSVLGIASRFLFQIDNQLFCFYALAAIIIGTARQPKYSTGFLHRAVTCLHQRFRIHSSFRNRVSPKLNTFLQFNLHRKLADHPFQFCNPSRFLLQILRLLEYLGRFAQKFLLPPRQHCIFDVIFPARFCYTLLAAEQFKHNSRFELRIELPAFL
jgi:hypothetical protein